MARKASSFLFTTARPPFINISNCMNLAKRMLLSLLYHRVGQGKYATPLPLLESQLEWIAANYHAVHPGDPLQKKSLCLTFDDAFYDFYHYIFPLLKRYQLKAVLAVPVAFIADETALDAEKRLEKIPSSLERMPPVPSPAFCTWRELKEMQASGLVHIASHSATHLPLTAKAADPQHELLFSKQILEEKLKASVTTFVYPYGRFNAPIHKLAKKHYTCIMRIGNALNLNWKNTNQLFYRVNADSQTQAAELFSLRKNLIYFFRFLLNICRRR